MPTPLVVTMRYEGEVYGTHHGGTPLLNKPKMLRNCDKSSLGMVYYQRISFMAKSLEYELQRLLIVSGVAIV